MTRFPRLSPPILGLSLLFVLAAAGTSRADIISNLEAYWRMNEGAGQTAADSSGNGNDATLGASSSTGSDDPTWSTAGLVGHSLLFDGSDYLQTANLFDIGTGDVTVSMLFNQTNTSGYQYLLSNRDDFTDNFFRVGFDNGNGRLRIYTEQDSNSNTAYVTPDSYADDWYYLTVTRSGATGSLYVNGDLVTTFATRSGDLGNDTDLWYLGQDGNGNGWFQGYMSEVRVYSRALSATDVAELYAATVPEPSTVALLGSACVAMVVFGGVRRARRRSA